jgi:hypothetical protein
MTLSHHWDKKKDHNIRIVNKKWGTRYRRWLRHYATSRNVAGSSPDEVGISIYLILPSIRNEYQEYSWGVKGGRRVGLTNLPSSVSRLSRENMGASTSNNLMGILLLLQG